MIAVEILRKALTISVFVAVMMVVVEYFNVWTKGSVARALEGSRWRQYVLAAVLGATPGCLGAFVLVTLHVQRRISLGALVAGMLATSGDEAFVMLATFPGTALAMTAGLMVLGVAAGWATDAVVGRFTAVEHEDCCHFVEEHTSACECLPERGVLSLWRPPRPSRVVATVAAAAFVVAVAVGWLGEEGWNWERIAFLVVGVLGLGIAATASETFVKEHLWTHVARKHAPRLLAWTLLALAFIAAVEHFVEVRSLVADNRWLVLVAAALVGLIPTSGPHLVFVTLFAAGTVPLSVLVASSAVQDGHGMLPLLAASRRDFFVVKAINFVVGLGAGAVMMALGW
jgi:hypothetical protein